MGVFSFAGPCGTIECLTNDCHREGAPLLIMAHGFRGSREGGGRATLLAEQLADLCLTLRFNFNGNQILSRQVAELAAVIAAARRQWPHKQIFLLGRSLGGAAALITAARDRAVRGLILWATPHDLRQTFKTVLGERDYALLDSGTALQLADEKGQLLLTPDFLTDLDQYDLSACLRKCQDRPILFLHGAADATVVVEQAQANFALAGGDKELHIFPDGDHSFTNCSAAAGAVIRAWLQRVLSL